MAPQVPSIEPISFSAGDTVKWTKHLPDFTPDDGWVLTYAFRGEKGDGRLDVTASNVNGLHSVSIAAADTNLLRPGLYNWAAYVSQAGDRYKVGQGTTTVEPNLAVTNFSYDLRTPTKVRYDMALEMERKVSLGQTVMLNGRQYTQHNLKDLLIWIDRAKSDYALEVQANENPGVDPRKVWGTFRDR